MPEIVVTGPELQAVAAQLDAAAAAIAEQNTQAMGRVTALTASGWQGAASGSFEAAFSEWNNAAGQIQQALGSISMQLKAAASAYEETERGIASSFQG